MSDSSEVRAKLGERIPPAGSDSDTMFTNAEILDLLAAHGGVEGAVLEGWRRKAAEFANLVDTTEGTSKRAMSNLHAQALAQIKILTSEATGAPRAKSHAISRASERP